MQLLAFIAVTGIALAAAKPSPGKKDWSLDDLKKKIEKHFNKIDEDKNGKVSKEEMTKAIEPKVKIAIEVGNEIIEENFDRFKGDDDELSRDELWAAGEEFHREFFERLRERIKDMKENSRRKRDADIFNMIDTDGSGGISKAELKQFNEDEHSAQKMIDKKFEKFDADGDGQLTVEEVMAVIEEKFKEWKKKAEEELEGAED